MPGWIFRAEHQPRKRCSNGFVYAGMNAANTQKNFEKNRLEKSLEIKECECFLNVPENDQKFPLFKIDKNGEFFAIFQNFRIF